jgi:hypothetical protein
MKKQVFRGIGFLTGMVLLLFIGGCTEIELVDPGLKPMATPSIIKGAHTNGDFTWSPLEPGPGATVTLTHEADDGFLFHQFSTSPFREITYSADRKTATFVMPVAANVSVTVNADFYALNRFPFEIIKTPVTVGEGDFTVSPDIAIPGTPVTLIPIETNVNYEFSEWVLTGITEAALFPNADGSVYFFMPQNNVTVGAEFEANPVKLITTLGITLTAPVFDQLAPLVNTTAAVTASTEDGNIAVTATLSAIMGANLNAGRFIRKSAYQLRYTLSTTDPNGRFGNEENFDDITITLSNAASLPNADEVEYTFERLGNTSATLTVLMPRTVHWPAIPSAKDWAYESIKSGTGTARASTVSGNNARAHPGAPFLGNSWLLNNDPAVWQAQGSPDAHWVGIDLGEIKQVSTVIITWAGGASNMFDGITVGEIQYATAEHDDPDALIPFFSMGNYTDDGWTSSTGFANPLFAGGTRPEGGTATHPWWIILDVRKDGQPINARWIRVKATAPLTGGTPAVPGAHTNWPRVSCFEVYSEVITGPLPEAE